ncbi:hypothetical protein FA95DRAFT_1553783 [Auriscalpium vulgare]|uniref:Uncharacterized protein n=1 Tax=Auriscalpium vulgare TaxID=40419 RepID=A0ACB8S851_9AGAM|nr:hypothetical protein FA95DRAFT_1553783 [Auriscalpium vulgare]
MLKIPYLLPLVLLPSLSNAFSWQFNNAPRQCSNVSISITGAGQPPYSLLLIPSGPSPLANNVEVRKIQNIPFSGSSTTLNFDLAYPANSSFVAVVSDNSGFGSGGTSIPATVLTSDDASCYNPSQSVQGPWVFSINPTGGLTQCQPTRIWYEQEDVNGTVSFVGVIPGGDSFNIPTGTLSTNPDTGTGFNWTVDVRGGTNMFIVGNDDRGFGAGGSAPYTISYASDSSCLQNASPSSTAGSPAGGSYPTNTDGSSTGGGGSGSGGGGSSSNTGAIVGGVVGGIAALLILTILALWLLRRKRRFHGTKERPVNILQDDEEGDGPGRHNLPQYYEPEPFLVPDPTLGTTDAGSTHDSSGRPLSGETQGLMRPETPGQRSMTSFSTNTRKSGMPPVLRPVNVIQHDDAGPSAEPAGEAETIELPPAYNKLRGGAPTTEETATATAPETEVEA